MDPAANGWVLALWTGQRRIDVATMILRSNEFCRDEVESCYEQYLHRSADPIGMAAATAALQNGFPEELLTMILVRSKEYFDANQR